MVESDSMLILGWAIGERNPSDWLFSLLNGSDEVMKASKEVKMAETEGCSNCKIILPKLF